MRRLAILPLLVLMTACPKDKKTASGTLGIDTIPTDTVQTDLSGLSTNIPGEAPEAPKPVVLKPSGGTQRAAYPSAPPALNAAVERGQAATQFCYQEFGLKADPSLRGGVAMLVTVAGGTVTKTTVGASNWSSGAAGREVNRCLTERMKSAWKVSEGEVKAGTYSVPLTFRGA